MKKTKTKTNKYQKAVINDSNTLNFQVSNNKLEPVASFEAFAKVYS